MKSHPLCVYTAEIHQDVKIFEVFRLSAKNASWTRVDSERKAKVPGRAFVVVCKETLPSNKGRKRWSTDYSAIIDIADCNCSYQECPLALAMDKAFELGCNSTTVNRIRV